MPSQSASGRCSRREPVKEELTEARSSARASLAWCKGARRAAEPEAERTLAAHRT